MASRAAKKRCDAGFSVNNTGLAVFLDFKYAIERLGEDVVHARYGNLFDMYEEITDENKEPIAFDHDCREGICGMCSLYINGHPHGPATGATTCQIYMRRFKDGDTITVEPWRSAGFPVIRDLMVDRSAYDKIMQAGGYVSVNTGGIPDANAIPIAKPIADEELKGENRAEYGKEVVIKLADFLTKNYGK